MKKRKLLFLLLLLVSISGFYFTLNYAYKNKVHLQFETLLGKNQKLELPPSFNKGRTEIENNSNNDLSEPNDEAKQEGFFGDKSQHFNNKNHVLDKYILLLIVLLIFIIVLSILDLTKSAFERQKTVPNKRRIFSFILATVVITVILTIVTIQGMNFLQYSKRNNHNMIPPNAQDIDESTSSAE